MNQTVEPVHQQAHPYSDNAFYISLLMFAGKELMLPQADVTSVESVYELNQDTPNSLCAGHIIHRGNRVPVYALNSSLQLMHSVPENRVQCVIMQHAEGELAILCEHIRNIQLTEIRFEEVPECMNHTGMPLSHLAIYSSNDHSQKLGLVSNADRLARYIDMAIAQG